MHESPDLRLKVVRYHENRPLHFVGEVFRVQCASRNTANSPGHDTQDPGWVALGRGAAIGSKSAAERASRLERGLRTDLERRATLIKRVHSQREATCQVALRVQE